jgi:hypothetical protein
LLVAARYLPGGPESQVVPASGEGSFSGAVFGESNIFCLILILADNYSITPNDPTTEAQSAQRTHRDCLAEYSGPSPAGRSLLVRVPVAPGLALVGLADRDCGEVARGAGLPERPSRQEGRAGLW